MRRGNGTTIGIIGAILVGFTLIAFFLLNIERIGLYLWALTFLLVAEIVLCTGLIATKSLGANHSKVFVKSGIIGSLFLYFLATLISVLSVRLFENKPGTFIILEFGIIVLFAIIILSILAFSQRIADNDRKIVEDRGFMEACEKRVYDLLSDDKNKEYVDDLNALFESLKYSDKIGASSADDKIAVQITILENALNKGETSKDDVRKIFGEISTFMNQRKGEMKELKRGGF